jgi:transcriptional regulator of met regulon
MSSHPEKKTRRGVSAARAAGNSEKLCRHIIHDIMLIKARKAEA